MKILITSILQYAARIGGIVSSIWAIIDFVLYLAKDHVFNWWSVYAIIICITAGGILMLINLMFMLKAHNKKSEQQNELPRMIWKERLEQKAKQRNML